MKIKKAAHNAAKFESHSDDSFFRNNPRKMPSKLGYHDFKAQFVYV